MWIGPGGPKAAASESRRLLSGIARTRQAVENGAVAVLSPPTFGLFGGGGRGSQAPAAGGGRGGAQATTDFTTVQRYDAKIPPTVSAQDEFFDFLFSGSDVKYAELKALAEKQEPLPRFALEGVKLTINVDADYAVVNTRLTRNVVGVVEGADSKLKDTFVAFGAHYDHTGYQQTASGGGGFGGGSNAGGCAGQTRQTPRPETSSTTAPTMTGQERWR